MCLHFGGAAFRQQLTHVHHRDDITDSLDETHVVFDDDKGVLALQSFEQFGCFFVSWAVMPAVGSSIRISSAS